MGRLAAARDSWQQLATVGNRHDGTLVPKGKAGGSTLAATELLPASHTAAGADSFASLSLKLACTMPLSALLSSSIRILHLGTVQQGGGSVMSNKSTKAVEPAVGLLGLWIDCLGTRVLLHQYQGRGVAGDTPKF